MIMSALYPAYLHQDLSRQTVSIKRGDSADVHVHVDDKRQTTTGTIRVYHSRRISNADAKVVTRQYNVGGGLLSRLGLDGMP